MDKDLDLTDSNVPILLTIEEVAVILSVSSRTVDRYIQLGLMEVIRLGPRMKRISLKDLETFIERKRDLKP